MVTLLTSHTNMVFGTIAVILIVTLCNILQAQYGSSTVAIPVKVRENR